MKNNICSIIFFAIVYFANTLIGFSQVLSIDDFEKKYAEMPSAQLVDVRTTGEYGGGHLPKSQNIDYRSTDFTQKIQTLDKTKPVFVYCLSGGRSSEAANIMKQNGFSQVYEMGGGYLKWTTKMKPVEGVKIVEKSNALSKEYMDKLLKDNKIVVLDFYATWCGPCIKMMPTVDKLKAEMEGKVAFEKVDSDANKALVAEYKIDEIPTFLIYKNGKLTMRAVGFQTEKGFREMIGE
ncbi:thioredoxin domain-containing protein [Arcicella sp. LKC2W]|uniref:thioredoxin domain-containing protein n=1 Tax=Arcicella sp. LKC2W TaxID=2984198 RepID=UPI002B216464|nr:thioredoxin domain-containing protein [Arcicella sp. LKC2W]MEA5461398.1 thioredoxin domain-containing protein [Arcicella sp. LKC2W]